MKENLASRNGIKVIDLMLLICGITLLAGLFSGLGMVVFTYKEIPLYIRASALLFSFLWGFILFPKFLLEKVLGKSINFWNDMNYKRFSLEAISVIVVSCRCISVIGCIFYFMIAFCEETLFRGIMSKGLIKVISKKQSILICSIAFAFILHLNDNIWTNLLLRFPLSLLLFKVADNYSLQEAICLHWGYDLVLSILN